MEHRTHKPTITKKELSVLESEMLKPTLPDERSAIFLFSRALPPPKKTTTIGIAIISVVVIIVVFIVVVVIVVISVIVSIVIVVIRIELY